MKTVFLVLDTVRRDYLEAYGNEWVRTPSLARLSRAGVTFDNHWVGSLPCMPARREFMTGRYNFLDRSWGPIEPFDDTLPKALRLAGVFTHLITDHFHYFELGGENYHTSFNTWDFHRGQEHDPWASFVDALAMPEHMGQLSRNHWHNRKRMQHEPEFSGPRTIAAAIQWLEDNRAADNWFLQVELFDPHEPFYCTDEYKEMYNDTWEGPHYDWPHYELVKDSPEAIEHIRKCYAGLLTMTDRWVGKLLDALEALHLWGDTLVIFTTDHGTMLAEHGYWMKNFMPMYNEIVRIPLVMKLPGGEMRGERRSAMTQTIDIMPTVLEFHGAASPPFVQGRSIRAALDGANPREDGIFGYFGKALNITDGRYVYMRNPVREDGGPLHAYTAMPVMSLNQWLTREVYPKVEMGRYFAHAYNLPLYRIPVPGSPPTPPEGEPSLADRHLLFDILEDPLQERPLQRPDVESRFVERIGAYLRACEAQPEQYERLGIPRE